MDEYLARIYGTGGGEDIEKTAQYHLMNKLASDGDLDLSGLSDDELQALSEQVGGEGDPGDQGGDSAMEAQAQQELLQKEAAAKFEEADFLGRVMAHAYTQELQKIAAEYGPDQKEEHKRIARGQGRIGAVGGALAGGLAGASTGGSTMSRIGRGAAGAALGGGLGYGTNYVGARVGNRINRAVGGEGSKEKNASAFEKLAEMRAAEMLDAVGVDPSTGQEYEQQGQGQPGQGQPGQQPQGRQAQPGRQQPGMQGQPGQQRQPMQNQQPQQPTVSPEMIAQEMQRRQQEREQQQVEERAQQELAQRQQMAQQQGGQQPGMGQPGMQGQDAGGQIGDEQFENAVNQRALEMLQAHGYNPEVIIEQLVGQQQGGQQGQQPQQKMR